MVWTHQNASSLPELVFGENMHINYNNTHKYSYYKLRTMKSRDNLDLLIHEEMIFTNNNNNNNKKEVEVLMSYFSCNIPVLSEISLSKLPEGEGASCS